MASVRTGAAWTQLQRLFGAGTVSGLTEWQLLRRYAERGDPEAFGALAARHAPMVLAVCRRVLHDPEDVEDAFQATFLVLIRKAGALRPHDALGGWLYGVAYRVSLRARSETARRRSRERTGDAVDGLTAAGKALPDLDLGPVLDEELRKLPATYRKAVVLCYLDGRTHEEAARQLGWPLGTVKGRLARARELLRGRLTRRGVSLPAGGIVAALAREAEASVPVGWIDGVVKVAGKVAAGEATAGVVSASALALAEGVIGSLLMNQWKTGFAALLVVATVTAGAGALAQRDDPDGKKPADTPRAVARDVDPGASSPLVDASVKPAVKEEPGNTTSKDAEPAPKSSGRRALEKVAREGYELAIQRHTARKENSDAVHAWSRRIADIETDTARPSSRLDAAKGHLKRMKALEDSTRRRIEADRNDDPLDRLNALYYREDAERLVKNAGAETARAVVIEYDDTRFEADQFSLDIHRPAAPTGSKGGKPGTAAGPEPGKDARSLAILKALETPVAMNFPNETPLEDVLKYLKQTIQSPEFPNGVPIYVDPIGLQEAEKTMSSPITLDLEGVPLKRTLHLLLKQLGLEYQVQDGMIYIGGSMSEDSGPLPPPISERAPIMVLEERAERGELSAAERKAFIEMLKDRQTIDELLHPRKGQTPKKLDTSERGGFQ